MATVFQLIDTFLLIYTICVFVWALISWLPMISPGLAYNDTVVVVRRFLDSVVDPYMRLFRNLIPPLNTGGTMIDLSAMVGILALLVVRNYVMPTIEAAVL